MHIVKFSSENVKRLKAVEITPQGNTVVIGGRNGQGKTSVLDSIEWAIGGTRNIQDVPIRRGATKAEIVIETEDLKITRTFGPKGTNLVVSNPDGSSRFNKPQELLDRLYGKLSFDPIGFMRLKPTEQLTTLRELVGIDTADLDGKHKSAFDQRSDVNRDLKSLQARFEGAVQHTDAPEKAVSVTELMVELKLAQAHNKENEQKRDAALELATSASGWAECITRQSAKIEQLEQELREEREHLETIKKDSETATKRSQEAEAEIAKLEDKDTDSIVKKIESAESINAKVTANEARKKLSDEVTAKQKESDTLTERLEAIAKAKEDQLAAAKFPINGLGFGDTGVLFNGIPLEQSSGAEQLRVSMAIGMALNPKLNIVLCRDASLLDSESMRIVHEMAKERDAQVWLEVVSEDGEGCSVVIEDGAVAHAEVEVEQEAELATA